MSKGLLESVSEISNSIGPMVKSLTLGKFLKWIITLIIIGALVLFVYDFFFSSKFHFDKLERKLELLEKAKSLHPNDSLVAAKLREQTLIVIQDLEPPKVQVPEIGITRPESTFDWKDFLVKFGGAFLIPIAIVLGNIREEDFWSIFWGSIMIGLFFGVVGYAVPTIYSVWAHLGLILLLQIVALALLARLSD